MNEVAISIIIPVYNLKGYINRCLDSMVKQTFHSYEIIVIDDGSTDGSGEIIDEYKGKYPIIQVIHKKNEGVSIARNTGIDRAKGKYILFFDGDDFIESYCLKELYELAEKNNADTIINGYHLYEKGSITETIYPRFKEGLYIDTEIFKMIFPSFIGLSNQNIRDWLSGKKGSLVVENPALWRSMVSTELIKKNRLRFDPSLSVGEDTLFISEYLTYAKRCYVNQKCYYYLVKRETSAISTYEGNGVKKLKGKQSQLEARLSFTHRLAKRMKVDITDLWSGTVLMSCMELAFLLTKKSDLSFMKKYRLYQSYVTRREVKTMIKNFVIGKAGGIKKIPFFFLKMRWNFVLFLSVKLLNIMHYEFNRS